MREALDRLESLFAAALKKPAVQRAAYVEQACADDPALRQRVYDLLRAQEAAGSFLESHGPASPLAPKAEAVWGLATTDEPITERPGTVLGPYKLMEQIGEGGMGLVFVAEQTQPVRRKVALKVIKPGMDSRAVIARFEAERQALALMDHPNIAKAHDGGTTPAGRPYFVMELVKGVPITEYCDQNQVPIRERLALVVDVCLAVQHAHQKGVIHRDIKPSNVLVVSNDGTPLVKVIDFGVAKAVGQQLTDKTVYTQLAQLLGTPLYMSPEQAGQSGVDVDTRTDVYALGVLLYELLTGTTPFDKERLRDAACDEIRHIIREEEPPRPSARISTLGQAAATVSTQRKSDPKRLRQLCRGELDWIVMKALEKDRNRRYESASAFAADVQRYLNDEPVQACPPSAWYRCRKFARRNRAMLVTMLLACAALVTVVVALAVSNVLIRREKDLKEGALNEAEEYLRLVFQALNELYLDESEARLDRLPAGGDAHRLLNNPAEAQLQVPFLEKGVKFYEKLATRQSLDPRARFLAAQAYWRVADLQKRLQRFEQAEDALLHAIPLLEKLCQEFPENAEYVVALGATYHQRMAPLMMRNKLPETEAVTRQAVLIFQETCERFFPEDRGRRLWYLYRDLGEVLLARGRLKEAEENFRQVLVDPNQCPKGWHEPSYRWHAAATREYLADLLLRTGRLQEAERYYTEAASGWEECLKHFIEPGLRWPNEGDYRGHLAQCCRGRGAVLRDAGRRAEAVQAYREAVVHWEKLAADDPRNNTVYLMDLSHCWFDLADILRQDGQQQQARDVWRQALVFLEKLLQVHPKDAGCRNRLAWLLAMDPEPDFRNPGRAVELAKEAVTLAPNHPGLWSTLGVAHYRAGDWKRAIEALAKSMELQRGAQRSFDTFFLAMAHWQLGEKAKARQWHDKAVQWMENNDPTNVVLRRLRAEAGELLETKEKNK
jgi:serine/threonine protein kinase/Flp pilus assembly protein TadD